MSKFLQNLNGNPLCAVDIEVTGHTPGLNDLVQVAIILLDGQLDPCRSALPFTLDLRPKRPDVDIDPLAMRMSRQRYCEIVTRGMDPYEAADRFVEWFEKIRGGPLKKIMPLACDWPYDAPFLRTWLGDKTFDMCFHRQYRDILPVATFLNDRAGWRAEIFPYPHIKLITIARSMRLEWQPSNEAVDDAVLIAEIYRRMIRVSL